MRLLITTQDVDDPPHFERVTGALLEYIAAVNENNRAGFFERKSDVGCSLPNTFTASNGVTVTEEGLPETWQ